MNDDNRTERLEERLAHQEREIETLSEIVREQGVMIDKLTSALMRFRDRLTEVEESGEGPHPVTKPPHY